MVSRRVYLVLLLSSVCSVLFFAFSSQAHASSRLASQHSLAQLSPITIVAQTYTINFPKSIDFQLSARDSAGNITAATLFISSDAPRYISEEHPITLTPTSTVTLPWHEDTSGDHFLTPGSHISYYWQLQDANGVYDLPTQTFHTQDTRFSWQQATQGLIQIHWYNRPTSFGQTILSQASTNMARIAANLGGGLKQVIDLWVYQSDTDFRGSLPPDTHEWVGGVAFINLNQAFIVVTDPSDETLIRDMPHELTHLLFHQQIAQGIFAPTWFDEGLAVYNQDYQEPDMKLRLKQALAAHDLLSLNTLYAEFPADADKAYLAYAQSWNLIGYMYSTYGRAKMAVLIHDMNDQHYSFDQDVVRALGVNEAQLENNWHGYLNLPTLSLPVATPQAGAKPIAISVPVDTTAPLLLLVGVLLVLLPLGGITGLLLYQRHNRRRTLIPAQHAAHTAFPQYGPAVYPGQPVPPVPPVSPISPVQPATFTYPQDYQYPSSYVGNAPYAPPVSTSYEQETERNAQTTQPFSPNQEYLERRPAKQAPQE